MTWVLSHDNRKQGLERENIIMGEWSDEFVVKVAKQVKKYIDADPGWTHHSIDEIVEFLPDPIKEVL